MWGILLIDARLQDNQILSLIGLLFIFGALVRVANSQVLGLFAGLVQSGMVGDLLCEGNTWWGGAGILLTSLSELIPLLYVWLTAVLGQAGAKAVLALFQRLPGVLKVVGLAALLKIQRNAFFTANCGIWRSDAVFSADLSVTDNSFFLCRGVGIKLGLQWAPKRVAGPVAGPVAGAALYLLSLRHLIQGNALWVQGTGISSGTSYTIIQDNSVTCPEVAIALEGSCSEVRNNTLLGTGQAPKKDVGLIMVDSGAKDLRICGNRIQDAPGHGILIQGEVGDLLIDDNLLHTIAQNGISTAKQAISVSGLRVSRNRVRGCAGGGSDSRLWCSGALVIGTGSEISVVGNSFTENGHSGPSERSFHVIFMDEVTGVEIAGNLIAENVLQGGSCSIKLFPLQGGSNQIYGNTVRGNGGIPLYINGDGSMQVQVQDNFLDGGENSPYLICITSVDSLQFQGNQCFHSLPKSFPLVYLWNFERVIVNGNTIQSPSADNFTSLDVSTFSITSKGIITSNLTSGRISTSNIAKLVIEHNL